MCLIVFMKPRTPETILHPSTVFYIIDFTVNEIKQLFIAEMWFVWLCFLFTVSVFSEQVLLHI